MDSDVLSSEQKRNCRKKPENIKVGETHLLHSRENIRKMPLYIPAAVTDPKHSNMVMEDDDIYERLLSCSLG